MGQAQQGLWQEWRPGLKLVEATSAAVTQAGRREMPICRHGGQYPGQMRAYNERNGSAECEPGTLPVRFVNSFWQAPLTTF